MKKRNLLLLSLAIFSLVGCGEKESETSKPTENVETSKPTEKPVETAKPQVTDKETEVVDTTPSKIDVTSISLDKTEATIYTGETLQLTASVLPEDASDKTVTFSSSDTTKLTVTETGLVSVVSSVKEGSVTITATSSNGLTASCVFTIGVYEEVTFPSTGVMVNGELKTDSFSGDFAIDNTSFIIHGNSDDIKTNFKSTKATIDGVSYESALTTGGSSQKTSATLGYLYKRSIDFTSLGSGEIAIAAKTGSTDKIRPIVLLNNSYEEIDRVNVNTADTYTFKLPASGTYRLAFAESINIYKLGLRYVSGESDSSYVSKTYALSDNNVFLPSETKIMQYKTSVSYGNFKINGSETYPINHDFSKKTSVSGADVYERYNISKPVENVTSPVNTFSFVVTEDLLNSSTATTKAVTLKVEGLCTSNSSTSTIALTKDGTQVGSNAVVSTSMVDTTYTVSAVGEYKLGVVEGDTFGLFSASISAVLADA